ncbi:MAG: carboxypeptidase-like regulatory domain-containing protein [Planctomycetota bacterium]|jgi:hypothetical protein
MRTVALLLAVFGAGIALGYVFGSREAGPGRSGTTLRPVTEPEPSVAAPRAAPPPALRAVLDQIPPPEVPRGEGTIRGQVRMEGGEPVAGALVVARPTTGAPRRKRRRGLAVPDEPSVEEWVRDLVTRRKWRDGARREARTDASGAYEITGLTNDKHSVSAYVAGYELRAARGQSAYNVRPDATVDFVARPIFELAVDVLLSDGSRPPWARIEVRGDSTGNTTWRRDQPWIQLGPGTYKLQAVVDEEHRSAEQQVIVEAGRPAPSLVFRLEGEPGIRGRILFPHGVQPGFVSVYALRFAGAKEPTHARLAGEGKNTGTSAAYEFESLEPGTYLVGAGYGNTSIAVTAVVVVRDVVEEQDLTLPAPDAGRFIVVHVLDPEGTPLGNVRFETSYSGGTLGASGGGQFFRRAAGGFLVPHHSWDTLQYGADHADPRWSVKAISDEYGEIKQDYTPGEDEELTIRFRSGARLTVRIAGYVDSGHEGHLIVVLKEAGAHDPYFGRRHREKMPDEHGKQRLGPYQPGTYEAILVLRRSRGTVWPLERVPLELRPGENELAIALPPLHTLTVVAEPGLRVRVSSSGRRSGYGPTLQRATGEDGKAVFEHLPAGEYRVNLRGKDGKHTIVTVDVPDQAVVHLP